MIIYEYKNNTVNESEYKLIDDFTKIEKIIFLILPIFVSIFGIIGNILLLFYFKDNEKIENISKVLLIFHLIIQIISGFLLILSIPFSYLSSYTYKEFTKNDKFLYSEYKYDLATTIFFGLTTFTICINSCILVLIGFDRFLNVFFPIKSKNKQVKFSFFILLSISVLLSGSLGYFEGRDCLLVACFNGILYTVIIFLNITLLIIFYGLILYKLTRLKRCISSLNNHNENGGRSNNINGMFLNISKKKNFFVKYTV